MPGGRLGVTGVAGRPTSNFNHDGYVTGRFPTVAEQRYGAEQRATPGENVRHFRSILYALVLAPAAWVLVGVGLTQNLTARGRDGFAVESFTGLLLLVLGGAAYGILIFAPISPAGPFLAGLTYLGVAIWAIWAPSAYAGVWPSDVTKAGFDLSRPGYGLAALLAVPLVLTALSARRWARYEPPVLPIIGQLGRARGAAPAPGTPIAIAETTVIPGQSPARSGGFAEAERTAVLRMPVEAADTTAIVVPAVEEATVDVVAAAEEPTVAVVTAAEEPTVVVVGEGPTAAVAGQPDEETTATVVDGAGENEKTEDVVEEPAEVAAEVAAEDEPTETLADEPARDETTDAAAEEPAEDETAETFTDETAEDKTTEAVAGEPAGDEETEDIREEVAESAEMPAADQPRDEAAAPDEPDEDEKTTSVIAPVNGTASAAEAEPDQAEAAMTPGDDEWTQVLRLPARAADADAAEKTQAIHFPVGAEPTQALTLPKAANGEKTQVIRSPADNPGETTQVFGASGERTRRIPRPGGDVTQVIRSAGRPADSERTQVIRPGQVTPPGERTELLEPAMPDDRPTASINPDKAAAPTSIAGAERPNFAEDPTSRIVPPVPASDEPSRTMTVMNLERPPDDIPTQRRPTPDED